MNRSDCGLWKGENLREIERKALFAHRKSRNEAEKSRPNEKHSKRFLESCHDFANETPKHQGICLLAHPMFVAGIAIDKLRGYTGIRCNCSIAQAPLPPLTQMESNRNSRPEDLQSPATDGGSQSWGLSALATHQRDAVRNVRGCQNAPREACCRLAPANAEMELSLRANSGMRRSSTSTGIQGCGRMTGIRK